MKLRVNERGITVIVLVFEIPIRVNPISSGRGDAIIIAPAMGARNFNGFHWKRENHFLYLNRAMSREISRARRSLTKRKISISPTTAPSPPQNAVKRSEPDWAISPKAIAAGATVKKEVKKIPAMKLPRNLVPRVAVKKCSKIPLWARITARSTLSTTIEKSRRISYRISQDFLFEAFLPESFKNRLGR